MGTSTSQVSNGDPMISGDHVACSNGDKVKFYRKGVNPPSYTITSMRHSGLVFEMTNFESNVWKFFEYKAGNDNRTPSLCAGRFEFVMAFALDHISIQGNQLSGGESKESSPRNMSPYNPFFYTRMVEGQQGHTTHPFVQLDREGKCPVINLGYRMSDGNYNHTDARPRKKEVKKGARTPKSLTSKRRVLDPAIASIRDAQARKGLCCVCADPVGFEVAGGKYCDRMCAVLDGTLKPTSMWEGSKIEIEAAYRSTYGCFEQI